MTIHQPVECQKIVVGTCPGTKDDAEGIAKGYIERYLLADGERCRYYLHEAKGVGCHYEIQQGGAGRAYLPGLAAALSDGMDTVILEATERHARVWQRTDGSLSCLWLSCDDEAEERERKGAASPSNVVAGPRMRVYRKKSAVALPKKAMMTAGLIVLGVSVTVATFMLSSQFVNADTRDHAAGSAHVTTSR